MMETNPQETTASLPPLNQLSLEPQSPSALVRAESHSNQTEEQRTGTEVKSQGEHSEDKMYEDEGHEYKLGCSACFIKIGHRIIDYRYAGRKTHQCQEDILLCRKKGIEEWHKVRPRQKLSSKTPYRGDYCICKDLVNGKDCMYDLNCTYAWNQEEIHIWTRERDQNFDRRLILRSLKKDYTMALLEVHVGFCNSGLTEYQTNDAIARKLSQPASDPETAHAESKKETKNQNPLHDTHQFRLGCPDCVNSTEKHDNNDRHSCSKDVQLCKRKESDAWHEIRRRPPRDFRGDYHLCEYYQWGCERKNKCWFAHNQEEIDVWTLEREGTLDRNQIYDEQDENSTHRKSEAIQKLICGGSFHFRFLCKACLDSKPSVESEWDEEASKCKENMHHHAEENKQLIRISGTTNDTVRIPPKRDEMCSHNINSWCARGDNCDYAHSHAELDVWKAISNERVSAEQIVKKSKENDERGLNGATLGVVRSEGCGDLKETENKKKEMPLKMA